MAARTEQREIQRDPVRTGVLVMTTFGLAWTIVGITGATAGGAIRIALYLVAVAAAVAVAAVSLRLRSRSAAAGSRPRRVSPHAGRVFNLVNLGQTVLIVVAVFALVRAGVPILVPAAVCLVVGLHFLPLARVFDVREYWWTGALLIVVAVAGIIAFAYGAGIATVLVVVGFPAAVVLWATSFIVAQRV